MAEIFTRRIFGVETEYGVTCTAGSQKKLGPEEIARYMFRPVVEKHSATNIFTLNSSRLYLDVGSHPEIATPECDSALQLLRYDKAGDVIIDRLCQQAEASLGEEFKVYAFKNNVDSIGNSYGCHENYLVGRSVVLKTLGKQFLPFLITRQLISGAGKIYVPFAHGVESHFEPGFCISQRADHVWEGVSSATTRSRPIINTRDEPHADSHKYRRLHVIVGDSNMAQPTTLLKIASTQLVLEMIEAGVLDFDVELADEITAIREIARDITGQTSVALKQGGTATALSIQRKYLDAALRYVSQREDADDFAYPLDLWQRTLDAIEQQDFSAVSTEIDWIIKYTLYQRYLNNPANEITNITHPKLRQIDLAYHDIRPGRGLASVLERKGLIKTLLSEQEILAAVDEAPQTTRAALRGNILAAAEKTGQKLAVDWMRVASSHPEIGQLNLVDPFATKDSDVDKFIAAMEAHQ